MGSPMLGARLFSLCGIVFLVAGLFLRPVGVPSIDIYANGTYFVVWHVHLLFLSGLILWLYAGLYYLGARLFGLGFSLTLMVAHLLVTIAALLGLNSIRYLGIDGIDHPPVSPLIFRLVPVCGALFLIGALLFVVIVLLATVARIRRATA
jgi:heme/copper-type cytochrome/quinol oxidase subunit 1